MNNIIILNNETIEEINYYLNQILSDLNVMDGISCSEYETIETSINMIKSFIKN